MMRNVLRVGMGVVLCAWALSGCAYPVEAPPERSDGEQQSPTEVPWPQETIQSSDGSVRLRRARMSGPEEKYWREQYQQTELLPLAVPAVHQASVFRIRNSASLEDAALIGPRIFAYRNSDGARLAHRRNADGTTTLVFPVVLTDGLTSRIQSPNAAGMIRLPDDLLVQKPEELRRYLSATLGKSIRLGALPGCPKRIAVRVANAEYDVTPTDLGAGDHCPLNVPFSVALTLSEGDARFLLENALYTGAVEIRAIYETQVPFTVGRMALEIDKGRLLEELERAIEADGGYWFEAELRSKVVRVIRSRIARLSFQGDLSPQIDRIVTRVVAGFFEPLDDESRTSRPECVQQACVSLSYERAQAQETVSVTWEHSTTALTGQRYLTWTKLQPLQDRTVVIGESGERWGCSDTGHDGQTPCRPSLRNDGSSIETGLTVLPGDLIEITPTFLAKEERVLENPVRSQPPNMVCIRRNIRTIENCDDSNGRCRRMQVDLGCAEHQDQWTETTTYEMLEPRMVRYDRPVGQIQEIFGGLVLKFTFRKEGQERIEECPLNSFIQEGDGQALKVRLEDRPGCRVFERAGQDASVMLHLKNSIRFPVQYKAGSFIRRWNGSTEDRTTLRTYVPSILFGGTVAIRGYSVGSAAMGGSKAP